GGNRMPISNNSISLGLVVSGMNQVVGAIDGSGNTQVNAGSDLTADHIIQNALVIGGSMSGPATMTIDASDASGNPLDQSSGLVLAGSLTPRDPFGAGDIGSTHLSSGDSTDLAALSPGNSAVNDNSSPIPAPATLVLALRA